MLVPDTAVKRQAGQLDLYLWHVGLEDNGDGMGQRQRYAYAVHDVDCHRIYGDNDLYSGVGDTADPEKAMGTLVAFLAAAAEAYGHRMRPYGPDTDAPYFPEWVQEAAYCNDSELSILSLELER